MKEKMKWFFLGVSGVVIGVLLTLATFRFFPDIQTKVACPSEANRQMQVWNDFSQSQREMLDHFDRLFQDDFSSAFAGGPRFFNSFHLNGDNLGVGELTQREDEKFIYFDLPVEDLNAVTVQSRIENGSLTVSGTIERKNESEGLHSSYRSQFQRTFPLPGNVDPKKMEVISENQKITFKFPKV